MDSSPLDFFTEYGVQSICIHRLKKEKKKREREKKRRVRLSAGFVHALSTHVEPTLNKYILPPLESQNAAKRCLWIRSILDSSVDRTTVQVDLQSWLPINLCPLSQLACGRFSQASRGQSEDTQAKTKPTVTLERWEWRRQTRQISVYVVSCII
ncbi:hypothetical protein P170DRAFT_139511 [Aspergillus steynii IBT 23096]|uniref:Uncharacterized protein n=1 Tax=Aspergillus steynii IBT 23096 TaxID=1392250 RepID=A0A2I2GBG7_9EURO|nr:uncharacterized protein P170DRAFT_139511 [Aspergillus steynii IBT 23096]PLB50232.1 hypothetical protein P170DRAFT_139511 [Aspergillus steynii IBT 23096]